MKRIFTYLLFALSMTTMPLLAQDIDESFVFIDEDGTVLEDGATVVRNLVEFYDEEEGTVVINSGLSVKNMTGSADFIKMIYEIERLDNGTYQICFPTTCNMQDEVGAYETAIGQLMGEVQNLMSEWFPVADGECVVTLTIELFTKQGFFPPSYVHKAYGPTVTLRFVKSSGTPEEGGAYIQLADGVYLDGSTLYICSGVTSLGDLQVNPSEIYCYATIPPACTSNTFTGYDATLHVPAAGMVSYFTTLYWYNFNNILSDAIEPLSVTINTADAELEIGQQLSLSATVTPSDATPKTVYWSSTDASVASVSAGGKVTAVSVGECDIIATCVDKVAVCHITVVNPRVTITLDKHEARMLPNHTMTLTATCSPFDVDLAVTSSNPGVAIPRLVNGTIMVVGVAEGTATITVNAADGWGHPDSCVVTVYTEPGDVNCDGYVNITDVTTLINFLLTRNPEGISIVNADTNRNGGVTISDVTTLINFLLTEKWSWESEEPVTETFTVNGVSFKMVYVEGGTFTMGNDSEGSWEQPAHNVSLSSFGIGQTEITQELWQAVMGENPSHFAGDISRPVEQVSWNDCQLFLLKLNEMTGKQFRMPSEAEWEFAARGGNKSQSYTYSGSNNIDEVGWCNNPNGNSSYPDGSATFPVGAKKANELGLYDMTGNVWEYVQDWWGNYSSDAVIEPKGPTSGSRHVIRGGCVWTIYANNAEYRVSYRNSYDPIESNRYIGFRLALDEDKSSKFRLSKTVAKLSVGEYILIDILNGNGSYAINSGPDDIVTCFVSGNSLKITGTNKGITTVYVTNTTTGISTILTVIVEPFVDLGLPSGTLWATCNVGADSPEDYGDYFAWGETEPKESIRGKPTNGAMAPGTR